MARTFAGTTNRITVALGGTGVTFGPGTVAAIVRRTTDGTLQVINYSGGNSGTNRLQFGILATNTIQLRQDAATTNSAVTVTAADGWVLIAATKATGTVAVRFHKYVFSTNSWTHQNGGSIANSGTMTGSSYIGDFNGGGSCFVGDIAAMGRWSVEMSDAQVESLPLSLQAWFAAGQPAGLWLLDQSATAQTVIDLSGGGANQSAINGTSVSAQSVPGFSYGARVAIVTRRVPVILLASAIPSGEAVQAAFARRVALPPGAASQEALGAARLARTAYLPGVGSGELLGGAYARRRLLSQSAPTGEAFGAAAARRVAYAAAAGGGEAFGTAAAARVLRAAAAASSEAPGTPTLIRVIAATPASSAEAFGDATLLRVLRATLAASAEAFGLATVGRSAYPSALASGEAFGVARILRLAAAASTASGESVSGAVVRRVLAAAAADTSESVSGATVRRLVAPAAGASAEALGTPTVARYLYAANLSTGEAFGVPLVAALAQGTPSVVGLLGLRDVALVDVAVVDGETWLIAVSDLAPAVAAGDGAPDLPIGDVTRFGILIEDEPRE